MSFIVPILAFMTNEEHTNDAQGATAEEAKVEKMFEYGYRKSNYGPDELVTDAHGNPPAFRARPVRQSACAR